jgi:hypothetical protein
MTLTPTDKGSLFAGIGMWALLWGAVAKVDGIPIVNRFINRDKIFRKISANKSVSLLITEGINFGVHGVSNPTGVIFALGGTIVNAILIFIVAPFVTREQNKKHREALLRSTA